MAEDQPKQNWGEGSEHTVNGVAARLAATRGAGLGEGGREGGAQPLLVDSGGGSARPARWWCCWGLGWAPPSVFWVDSAGGCFRNRFCKVRFGAPGDGTYPERGRHARAEDRQRGSRYVASVKRNRVRLNDAVVRFYLAIEMRTNLDKFIR